MKHFRLFVYLLCFTSFLGCGDSSNLHNSDDTATLALPDLPFSAFSDFPTNQFKNIALGNETSTVLNTLESLNPTHLASTEVDQYYFEDDSTELIIPDEPKLAEFKVVLRSTKYLVREEEFRRFFEDQAQVMIKHPTFPVFQFSSGEINFRMTYFSQPTFIRLHFIRTSDHT